MKKYIIFIIIFILFLFGCESLKQNEKPVGGKYDKDSMQSLVNPPKHIPLLLKPAIKIADKKANKKLITGRVLAWNTKISLSSGILELYVEDGAAKCLSPRLIKIIRLVISYAVPSAFAVDINSQNYTNFNITEKEFECFRGKIKIDQVETFTEKEKTALKYALALSKTPVILTQKLLDELRANFSEKQIVAIAALTAKVNYWTRLIEGLRIKPAGYVKDDILHLEECNTYTNEEY